MLRACSAAGLVLIGVLISSGPVLAQGGATCGAGGTAGGGIPGSGQAGTPGGTAPSGFGLLSQLAAIDQTRQEAQSDAKLLARDTQLQTLTTGFVRRAMTFDDDGDQQLNRNEMNDIAAAVIAELRAKQGQPRSSRRSSRRRQSQQSISGRTRSANTMQETFVTRAMSFDQNDDGMLSSSEAQRMAKALILSLS